MKRLMTKYSLIACVAYFALSFSTYLAGITWSEHPIALAVVMVSGLVLNLVGWHEGQSEVIAIIKEERIHHGI